MDYVAQELKQCVDEMTSGFLITDCNGFIRYFNKEYVKLTKLYTARPGEHILKYQRTGNIQGVPACMTAASEGRKILRHFAQTKDGIFIVSSSEPVFEKDGTFHLVVTRVYDMTEFFALEDDINRVHHIMEQMADEYENSGGYGPDTIAVSKNFTLVLDSARTVSKFDIPVLITGESGSGKDVVARFIHKNSKRANGPFVAVNCAAIPNDLLETELFGYAKGTFTGQIGAGKEGLFAAAKGGTLFLDEIGDMPLALQAKILRVLESNQYRPVGGSTPIDTDVRIISATNHNLKEMVDEGTFREDLFYRINVMELRVPPLRERQEDIVPLCLHFLKHYNHKYNLHKSFATSEFCKLMNYRWPGNVRQLKNAVEMMIVLSEGNVIKIPKALSQEWEKDPSVDPAKTLRKALQSTAPALGDKQSALQEQLETLKDFLDQKEKEYLIQAYQICRSTRKMATELAVDHSTIIRKLKRHGIDVSSLN